MSNKPYSDIPWWAILMGFIFCWPIGLVLLFMSLGGTRLFDQGAGRNGHGAPNIQEPDARGQAASHLHGQARTGQAQTPPSAQQGTARNGSSGPESYHYGYSTGQSAQKQRPSGFSKSGGLRRFFKKPKSGRFMTTVGTLMSFCFAIALVDELSTAMEMGFWRYISDWFPVFGFLCAGLFLLGRGISTTRWSQRAKLYQNVIGQRSSIFLSDLAATAGVSEKKVCADLQRMLSDGTLPSGYIDRASGRLVLLDLNQEPEAEARPEPPPKKAPAPERKAPEKEAENPDDALLRQIQEVNDAIPDPVMSMKIDRIEEITRKILVYQKKNPAKSDQLRQFLNYYLPTTLKILNAYAQMDAQGVEGRNISAAKHRIEGMMDKVVEGFEKQLDQLFQTDAMDITADVEVLERMLDRDGLGSGMTLGGL